MIESLGIKATGACITTCSYPEQSMTLYEMFHNTLHVHMHSCTHNQNGVTAADVARVEEKEDILKVLSAVQHQKATPTTDELSVNDDQTQTAQLPTEMQRPASCDRPPSPSAPPPAPAHSTHITTTPSSSQPTSPSAQDTTSCDEPHSPTTATCNSSLSLLLNRPPPLTEHLLSPARPPPLTEHLLSPARPPPLTEHLLSPARPLLLTRDLTEHQRLR